MKEIIKIIIDALDDKAGVIFVLCIICVVAMLTEQPDVEELIKYVVVGLLGMATGKIKKS
jgi:hypothetical protein